MRLLGLLFLLSIASSSFACTEDGKGGFLPDNDLNIPVSAFQNGGISEQEFNAVIDRFEAIYTPIAKKMGGNLKIARKWSDGTVNASAMRRGSSWNVNMFGGLARHKDITSDGFAMVLCHEIGHHIGGAPKVNHLLQYWASNEGQSDYFASLKCLRRAFINDDNEAVVSKMIIPEFVTEKCNEAYSTRAEQMLCIRISMAGDSLAALLASLRNQARAQFNTPDPKIVSKTDHAHPAAQCRLDTYFQGALCDRPLDEELSQKDEKIGTCHPVHQDSLGLRPLCWFKPQI